VLYLGIIKRQRLLAPIDHRLGDIPLKVSERIRNMNDENYLTLTEELLKSVIASSAEVDFLTAWEKNMKETLAWEWEELDLN
jgi:hypothetical protein